jgi:hypothetical protein
VKRAYRPLLITVAFLTLFVISVILAGQNGWGTPAENEQAVGEVSRWCERVNGGFLREPVNTLGNLGFVAAGLLMFWVLARDVIGGREAPNRMIGHTPISMLYAAAAVFLGPGSMVMHGTHTFFGAWLDNVSMVTYISIPWLLNLSVMGRWRDRKLFVTYASIIAVYAAGYWFIAPDFGIGFELFEVSIPLWLISEFVYRFWSPTVRWASGFLGFPIAAAFGITPLTMIDNVGEYWWIFLFWLPGLLARNAPPGRRTYNPWFFAGVGSFLLAYAIWLTGTAEHSWCRPDSLIQAHALWHMLSALATWCFFVFLRTERTLPSPHDVLPETAR